MIGKNDVETEIFDQAAARQVSMPCKGMGVARLPACLPTASLASLPRTNASRHCPQQRHAALLPCACQRQAAARHGPCPHNPPAHHHTHHPPPPRRRSLPGPRPHPGCGGRPSGPWAATGGTPPKRTSPSTPPRSSSSPWSSPRSSRGTPGDPCCHPLVIRIGMTRRGVRHSPTSAAAAMAKHHG